MIMHKTKWWLVGLGTAFIHGFATGIGVFGQFVRLKKNVLNVDRLNG